MNKKILIILVIVALFIASAFYLNTRDNNNDPQLPSTPITNTDEKTVEVTDKEKIEKIKNDSYLNILLQIKTFDSLNVSYEPLLEAAMRIAGELDLYQTPENGAYVEYVPRSVVHELIYELSGIRITEPIMIEDFYYLYDIDGDYYYIVPIGSSWLELKELNAISYAANSNQYIVKCSAENISDYAIKTTYPNVEVRLKYKPSNNYIKYQLASINVGKSVDEIIEPEENYYYEDDYDFNDNYDFNDDSGNIENDVDVENIEKED